MPSVGFVTVSLRKSMIRISVPYHSEVARKSPKLLRKFLLAKGGEAGQDAAP